MNGLTCVLCRQPVDLFELDAEGYGGDPAHNTCAQAARDALNEAIDRIAAENRKRYHRTTRRHGRTAA